MQLARAGGAAPGLPRSCLPPTRARCTTKKTKNIQRGHTVGLTHINPWHRLRCSPCTDRLAGAAVCLRCHARKPEWRSHRTRLNLPHDGHGGHTWYKVGVQNVGADSGAGYPITASEMHDVRVWISSQTFTKEPDARSGAKLYQVQSTPPPKKTKKTSEPVHLLPLNLQASRVWPMLHID